MRICLATSIVGLCRDTERTAVMLQGFCGGTCDAGDITKAVQCGNLYSAITVFVGDLSGLLIVFPCSVELAEL